MFWVQKKGAFQLNSKRSIRYTPEWGFPKTEGEYIRNFTFTVEIISVAILAQSFASFTLASMPPRAKKKEKPSGVRKRPASRVENGTPEVF